jgi:predicted dehydrogenase
MKPVKWGVISTADIGMKKVIPAMMKSPLVDVVAISSRSQDSADAAAKVLGIPKAYPSYEAMLADPEIEAVYNPLPNHLHVDLTLAAARAGKHVLCEKPIALNAVDAARLREAPKGIIISEAFMVRYHPQWLRARDLAQSGRLGQVRTVRGIFTYVNLDPDNVRNKADIGGGGLMDVGCYCITAGRFIYGAEPERVIALVDRDPGFGTDRYASVLADFGGGRHLTFTCGTQLAPTQRLEVIGDKARVEILIPYNAPQGQATALLIDDGHSLDGSMVTKEVFAPCDQYTLQGEAFSQAVRGERKLDYGVEHAISHMKVLDAIFESEKTGAWAKVG